jgi:5'-3' exonuclease
MGVSFEASMRTTRNFMILFDLSYFMHRVIHPNKETIIQNPMFFAHLMTTQIIRFSKQLGASKANKMVICLDSPSWRKDFYAKNKPVCPVYEDQTYKGNRVKDSSLPWDELHAITDSLAESFKNHSDLYVMKIQDAEADDIIAILSKEFSSKETIWVLSPDKDFVQLQDENVHVFDPLKNAFKPEQDVSLFKKIHNIIGDASDNIYTIKGNQKSMKESVALKLLKDLDDLLATNPLMKQKYDFNEKLIDLSMIPEYVKEATLNEFATQTHSFNATNILKTFMKFNMSKLSEDIGVFKLSENEIKTPTNQFFVNGKRNEESSRNNLEDFFS